MPENQWSEPRDSDGTVLEALVYRSNLLGSDRSIVNYGGGNTSSKGVAVDHHGREVEVMWIKGSGFDLETVGKGGFPAIRLDDVRAVKSRGTMSDQEMVEFLSHCSLDPSGARPSIETMLHGFLPFPHVDHTHPEAAIAMCCSKGGQDLMAACFGEELIWVPYVRPGFALAKLALDGLAMRPDAKGMLLAKHGLVTWGDTGQQSYDRTIEILNRAGAYLESGIGAAEPFGGHIKEPSDTQTRRSAMVELLPVIRGELSRLCGSDGHVVLHFDDSDEVLRFVCSRDMATLAETGAACPDHVMYTKFLPLVIDADGCRNAVEHGGRSIVESVRAAIAAFVLKYVEFFDLHHDGEATMLNPGPRVILIPGFGMVTAGQDAWTARNTAALYRTAIRVMRWGASNGGYTSLSAREAWNIEYWPLELYKLTLKAPPRELVSRVAVITGGAGAIGVATARRLLTEGAHVVVSDIESVRLARVAADLFGEFPGRVLEFVGDAAAESDVTRLFENAILAFGGVDIVIPNAGIASAGAIDEMPVEGWQRVQDVLVTGYFLACRAAFAVMKSQGMGGALVINSSKNGLAAGTRAIAYTTAKAAELHMARCLAEEGGRFGIRVNAVAPDAVIQGSGLWNEDWRHERARAHGFEVDQIEEFYRQRNALKVSVTADDVAESILFLVSSRSAKTTGCVITIDGGIAAAFPR